MRVVASLTTRPKYHKNFTRCLDSLLCQFDDVYLGLPNVSRKGVPYEKFNYKNVKVVNIEEDIGPATKILAGFIMEKDKDSLIVSVDDDNEYAPFLRSSLEKQRMVDINENKNRIITNAGHYIKYWDFGILGLNGGGVSSPDRFYDFNKTVRLTKLSGFAGVAYPSSIIPDINDFIGFIKEVSETHDSMISHDDISISAYLSHHNVDIILNPDRRSSIITYLSKGDGAEAIGEDFRSILDYSNKLKPYFKNNPKKRGSLVLLDLVVILICVALLVLIIYRSRNQKSIS